MLFKLSLRNVKRQFSDYAIYFISIMFSVAMMFSITNTLYSSSMFDPDAQIFSDDELSSLIAKKFCICGMFIVSAVIAVIQSNAQLNIIRLRKREFGTYLLLGAKTKEILKMYISETAFVFGITTVLGIFTGAGIYMAMLPPVANFLELSKYKVEFSVKAVLTTTALSFLVFIISSLSSAIYLKKTSINKLVNNITEKKKKLKRSEFALNTVLCIISLIMLISVVVMIYSANSFSDTEDPMATAVIMIIFMIFPPVGTILFNMSASRCISELAMKNKKFSSKGTNMFLLRQQSSRASANASVYASVSVIILLAVMGLNSISLIRNISTLNTDISGYSHDLMINAHCKPDKIIKKYTDIKDKMPYTEYYHNAEIIISETQANELLKFYGSDEKIETKGKCFRAITVKITDIPKPFLTGALKDIEYGGTLSVDNLPNAIIIIPDEYAVLLENDKKTEKCDYKIYKFENKRYDVRRLYKELCVISKNNSIKNPLVYDDLIIMKDYSRLMLLDNYAPYLLLVMYSCILFIIISMAVLAQKISGDADEDKIRYSIMRDMGVRKSELCRTLRKQTAVYFIFPLIIPLIAVIPITDFLTSFMGADTFSDFLSDNIYNNMIGNIRLSGIMTDVFIIIIFLLYYMITYTLLKRKIMTENKR